MQKGNCVSQLHNHHLLLELVPEKTVFRSLPESCVPPGVSLMGIYLEECGHWRGMGLGTTESLGEAQPVPVWWDFQHLKKWKWRTDKGHQKLGNISSVYSEWNKNLNTNYSISISKKHTGYCAPQSAVLCAALQGLQTPCLRTNYSQHGLRMGHRWRCSNVPWTPHSSPPAHFNNF